MKKELKNNKGFTLIEMLIVVAIIVILVAVSVPTYTTELNEVAKSADDANIRGAKSALVLYLTENTVPDSGVYYDAEKGLVGTDKPSKGYGKMNSHKNEVIIITWNESEGKYDYEWEEVEP